MRRQVATRGNARRARRKRAFRPAGALREAVEFQNVEWLESALDPFVPSYIIEIVESEPGSIEFNLGSGFLKINAAQVKWIRISEGQLERHLKKDMLAGDIVEYLKTLDDGTISSIDQAFTALHEQGTLAIQEQGRIYYKEVTFDTDDQLDIVSKVHDEAIDSGVVLDAGISRNFVGSPTAIPFKVVRTR